MQNLNNEKLNETDRKGLSAAIRIMDRWGLEAEDQARILDLEPSLMVSGELYRELGTNQLGRISYLLKIDASLRELDQNPKNHMGYMKGVNHTPPFDGGTPFDFIRSGEIDSLYEVLEHLELLKYGQ